MHCYIILVYQFQFIGVVYFSIAFRVIVVQVGYRKNKIYFVLLANWKNVISFQTVDGHSILICNGHFPAKMEILTISSSITRRYHEDGFFLKILLRLITCVITITLFEAVVHTPVDD
jgi:hypothetical protein